MATPAPLHSLFKHFTISNVFLAACTIVVVKYRAHLLWVIKSRKSPLRHLPGPKNENFFLGNLLSLIKDQNTTIWEDWVDRYGKILRLRGFFGSYQLGTVDMRAINFILSQPTNFQKTALDRKALEAVIGPSLLSADIHAHKRQRRIMNPSFGQSQIRVLVPIFCEKANQLRDIWLDLISNNPEGTTIDVLKGLNYATLDVIGAAGFGYEFNSLQDGDEDELAKAFAKIFDSDEDITTFKLAKTVGCRVLGIPTEESRRIDESFATARRIGTKIIEDKKAMLLHEEKNGADSEGRDILSLLIKSNLAQEANGDQAMSDEEVLGQISTFLVAGHETTGASTTWGLYALALYPTIQNKLRREILDAELGEAPSMADLDKLLYLDSFVHEVLRVYPAVPMVARQAIQDTVIPVAEAYKDHCGVVRTEIPIQKWDVVMIPILAMNRAKDVWGEDAMEFRPERWDDLPLIVKEMPGVWGHMMT
ncbi:hypothetical protein FRC09_003580 [Ceratobasidium sp. 395]|nr:hypothetical protein FRC09_003580 [Ceratobasidium sp. 395]